MSRARREAGAGFTLGSIRDHVPSGRGLFWRGRKGVLRVREVVRQDQDMAELVIEGIPLDIYRKLLLSAQLHKRSIEEEVLHILQRSVDIDPSKPAAPRI